MNIINDAKELLEEHRNKVYLLTLLFLVDHLIFKGKFRIKLEESFEKFVDKITNVKSK